MAAAGCCAYIAPTRITDRASTPCRAQASRGGPREKDDINGDGVAKGTKRSRPAMGRSQPPVGVRDATIVGVVVVVVVDEDAEPKSNDRTVERTNERIKKPKRTSRSGPGRSTKGSDRD